MKAIPAILLLALVSGTVNAQVQIDPEKVYEIKIQGKQMDMLVNMGGQCLSRTNDYACADVLAFWRNAMSKAATPEPPKLPSPAPKP